ncbi:hypothetical protein [Kribbella sp. NPDC051620]|uniref:hypothetical protein n=1 Tax=Kribbella sp. NPDC051620 TaxID=3364120 RepID=UPI0037B248A6
MVDVVGVHGISQQQAGRLQLLEPWRLALADGIERARGRGVRTPTLDVAYYGDLFLVDSTTKGGSSEVIEADTVSFFEEIQDAVVNEDEAGSTPGKGMTGVPVPLGRLAAWLERRYGVAGRLLFFGDLVQVHRYQHDDVLATAAHARIREALAGGPRVMVGHSLGSVVAYEALCRIPNHGITTLVTIGSPLGLRSIRQRLRPVASRSGLPPGVRTWVNIYDPRDPVSLAGPLMPYWPTVADATVDNGNDPHAVARYLGKRATGAAIADSLTVA